MLSGALRTSVTMCVEQSASSTEGLRIMDIWKFYDITHREHVVCNPTSEEKLTRLIGLLRLPAKARLVDIACGKGEFLIRLAEAYDIRGIGIDISPFCIGDARRRL